MHLPNTCSSFVYKNQSTCLHFWSLWSDHSYGSFQDEHQSLQIYHGITACGNVLIGNWNVSRMFTDFHTASLWCDACFVNYIKDELRETFLLQTGTCLHTHTIFLLGQAYLHRDFQSWRTRGANTAPTVHHKYELAISIYYFCNLHPKISGFFITFCAVFCLLFGFLLITGNCHLDAGQERERIMIPQRKEQGLDADVLILQMQ